MTITTFKFALNTWQHLYSLQRAVDHTDNLSGNSLVVKGIVHNAPLFNRPEVPIEICFTASDQPHYKKSAGHQIIFGQLKYNNALTAEIPVSTDVFNELKKNLQEYLGIDGIHIMITVGLIHLDHPWQASDSADIVQLDYAMKGEGNG